MICNLCGTENKDGSKFCKNCGQNLEQAEKRVWEMEKSEAPSGQSVTMDQTTGESQNQTAGSGVNSNMGPGGTSSEDDGPLQYNPTEHGSEFAGQEGTGNSTACLICGIVSIVLGCCGGWYSILLGILAIVFSKQENKKGISNSKTQAGFVCGIIGLVLGVIMTILGIVLNMGTGLLTLMMKG